VFCISIERPEVRKGQLLRLFRFEDWVIWPVNSDLKGDQTSHAFLWQRGLLRDIGTLGGDFAMSQWLDEDGGVDGHPQLLKAPSMHFTGKVERCTILEA
jgi:hypothetical protein